LGSGAGAGSSPIPIREDFPAVAWYLPNVRVDASGLAKLSLPIPDNATKWHVYAVAAGTDDSFGSSEYVFQSSAPLLIRPKVPRFARPGDRYEARFTVDTQLPADTSAEVELRAEGAVTGVKRFKLQLPAKGSRDLVLPVQVTTEGRARLTARVNAKDVGDALTLSHAVSASSTLQTIAFAGVVTGQATIPITLADDIDRTRGGLELRISDNPAALVLTRDWLKEYPYGCTEQLATKLLASLIGRTEPFPVKEREYASNLLREILLRQHDDGGFGYWPGTSTDRTLTLHVFRTLLAVQRSPLALPEGAVTATRQHLARQKLLPNQRAEFEALLVENGQLEPAKLEARLRAREQLDTFTRAEIAFALAHHYPASANAQLKSVLSALTITGTTAVATAADADAENLYASTVRNTAATLRALVAAAPKDPLVSKLTRGLLSLRRGDHLATTEDELWVRLALAELARVMPSEGPGAGRLLYGAQHLGQFGGSAGFSQGLFIPMAQLVAAPNSQLTIEASSGTIHYEAIMKTVPARPVNGPIHHGFAVARLLRSTRGDLSGGVNVKFPLGSYVALDLLVTSPVARDQVAIEIALPAGLEAVNDELAVTPRLTRPSLGPARRAEHRELREDRILLFVDHLAAGQHHFAELLRATTRGRFSLPAARIEAMYAPDVYGLSDTGAVEIE
jgi:uncharacterized protein YfaS (alpha-2-macroglobulin family)